MKRTGKITLHLLSACVTLLLISLAHGTHAMAETVTHFYDKSGRLIKSYYGSGKAISWQYDAAGNIVKKEITAATAPTTELWTNAAGDGKWNNPGNWQNGVPSQTFAVLIPAGMAILLSAANGECGNLDIPANTVLTIESQLTVNGVLKVSGQVIDKGVLVVR